MRLLDVSSARGVSRSEWVLVASMMLMCVLLAVGLGACGAGGPGEQLPIGAEGVSQARSFKLLGTRPEPPPVSIRNALSPGIKPAWDAAQLVPEQQVGRFWLIPDHQDLCIVAETQGHVASACTGNSFATLHGVAIVLLEPQAFGGRAPQRRIVGVAPNGVDRVSLREGSDHVNIKVSRNGVFERTDAAKNPPDMITLER